MRAAGGSGDRCPEPDRGVLPEWARTGFSDPEPRIEHVIGDQGRIAAIIFGPLASPPSPDGGNKILWVSRDPVQPLSDLQIRAEHDGEVVTRVVRGGPGPVRHRPSRRGLLAYEVPLVRSQRQPVAAIREALGPAGPEDGDAGFSGCT